MLSVTSPNQGTFELTPSPPTSLPKIRLYLPNQMSHSFCFYTSTSSVLRESIRCCALLQPTYQYTGTAVALSHPIHAGAASGHSAACTLGALDTPHQFHHSPTLAEHMTASVFSTEAAPGQPFRSGRGGGAGSDRAARLHSCQARCGTEGLDEDVEGERGGLQQGVSGSRGCSSVQSRERRLPVRATVRAECAYQLQLAISTPNSENVFFLLPNIVNILEPIWFVEVFWYPREVVSKHTVKLTTRTNNY